jgi:hypothetical protein
MSESISARHIKTPALVYVRGLRGPTPQIWFEPCPDQEGYWRDRIVAAHPLQGAVMRTLFETRNFKSLASLYPPPVYPLASD